MEGDGGTTRAISRDRVDTRRIRLADGRALSYCEYGAADGAPLFFFHGTPGSRLGSRFADEAGKEHGYRIIALDRPGIGSSDYVRNRTLLDWPCDVAQVAERLHIDRFGVMGVSGGGPYALVCAYSLAERLTSASLLGSWAPVAEEPSLWDEMAPLDRFFGKLSRATPWVFYLPFSFLGRAARLLSPTGFARVLWSSMSTPDRELVRDAEMAQLFSDDVKEGFRQGVRGPADDAIILYRDWGFSIGRIEAELDLYHGEDDRFAPVRFARYLHNHLPHSRLHTFPDEGHFYVMTLFGRILEDATHRRS